MIEFLNEHIFLRSADALMVLSQRDNRLSLTYLGEDFAFDDSLLSTCPMQANQLDMPVLSDGIFSSVGDGLFDETLVCIRGEKGVFTHRFAFENAEKTAFSPLSPLPFAHGKEDTLRLTFSCQNAKIKAYLYLSTFSDCGVFTCASEIYNEGEEEIVIDRLMSVQLTLIGDRASVTTFDGTWAKERQKNVSTVNGGVFCLDSKLGFSSARHNPFMLTRVGDTTVATNLIWSGNHKSLVDVSPLGKVTILCGLSDYNFHHTLKKGERLRAPEAVVCARKCEQKITQDMHLFVQNHIIPPRFRRMERPILFNNWEATYFNFNEEKLLSLAKVGAELGVELFVLDDGWFGKRDFDNCSLGDWFDNEKKTGGLKNLKSKVSALGLKFGLWFEPEMLNPDSELFRTHPEFAMRLPNLQPIQVRNQYILDFANPAVCDYIAARMEEIISTVGLDYIKWDCNRNFTDVYSPVLSNLGEYFYRYMVGFYGVLQRLTTAHPEILFEGCSSGGNRFDLGTLFYMPQTWCSDNTDARDRTLIQEGTLYAYPQSTMGAHVSICPNHQSGNCTSIENRFNVASLGAFGYEMDFTKCTEKEREAIKGQIAFYKKHRALLQFGVYRRLGDAFASPLTGWLVVSEDKSQAMACAVALSRKTNSANLYRLQLGGLDGNARYKVTFREQTNCERVKEVVLSGARLNAMPFDFGDMFLEYDRAENSNSIATRLVYFEKI